MRTSERRGRPKPGDVRGVVVDIDGTLSDSTRRVGIEAITALRKVNDSGVAVMLASGNVLPVAYSLAIYAGFDGPIIAENGGIICHRQKVWTVASPDDSRRAFEHLRKNMRVEKLFTDRWRETEVGIKREFSLEDVRRLLEGFEVDVQSTGWAIHIMQRGIDKIVGVRKACEVIGLSIEDVAAIGDSENDERMLIGCGWGIAVGNASDETKGVATYATKSGNGDGVVEALEWLRLL
ncbi:MAG: phosphoglycolate phosphatase [Methanobacteriota archaeon]|nr:MAG: phosphoglycolate phosphatase [Euryarchaeota archaeon]